MGSYFSSEFRGFTTTKPGIDGTPKWGVVVIPIDDSKEAEAAFLWYCQSMHRPENVVHIVHCQEIEHPSGASYPDYAIAPEAFVEELEKLKRSGHDLLAKYESHLKANNINGTVYVQLGQPGDVIVRAANEFNASHIVMGTRGFGPIRRAILGSVSDYVIQHSKVPVTVVPKEVSHWFY